VIAARCEHGLTRGVADLSIRTSMNGSIRPRT
jgi:hypothetical protein